MLFLGVRTKTIKNNVFQDKLYIIIFGNAIEMLKIQDKCCKKRSYMEEAVKSGTAKLAGCEGVSVAAKTGTAQISQGRGGYHTGVTHYLVSFAGFFPARKAALIKPIEALQAK